MGPGRLGGGPNEEAKVRSNAQTERTRQPGTRNLNLQKRAQRRGVGLTSCACRRQLDGVAIVNRRNTKRLERPQRAEGAKQRRPRAGGPRCVGAVYLKVATGEQLSSTVGQKYLVVHSQRAGRGGGREAHPKVGPRVSSGVRPFCIAQGASKAICTSVGLVRNGSGVASRAGVSAA